MHCKLHDIHPMFLYILQSTAAVTELKGRPWVIFAAPAEVSLACVVSADFEMHRGIAREFKKTFFCVENKNL